MISLLFYDSLSKNCFTYLSLVKIINHLKSIDFTCIDELHIKNIYKNIGKSCNFYCIIFFFLQKSEINYIN